MSEPYIGPLAPEWQIGRCAYSPTPADLACLRDARWHGIDDGPVARGLECCDDHKLIMATLVDYVHPLEPACGLPGAVFVKDENRCVVPWGKVERPETLAEAARVVRREAPPREGVAVATASEDGFNGLSGVLPSGREAPAVPAAAMSLVDKARAAGWRTLVQWGEDSAGNPFLSVDIGLFAPFHHYQLTWHSRHALSGYDDERDVSGVTLRFWGGTVKTTAAKAVWERLSSLKEVHRAIYATRVEVP